MYFKKRSYTKNSIISICITSSKLSWKCCPLQPEVIDDPLPPLRERCHEIFNPYIFALNILAGPQMNGLKRFRELVCFREYIRLQSSKFIWAPGSVFDPKNKYKISRHCLFKVSWSSRYFCITQFPSGNVKLQ